MNGSKTKIENKFSIIIYYSRLPMYVDYKTLHFNLLLIIKANVLS
jgi:hypothetical protein